MKKLDTFLKVIALCLLGLIFVTYTMNAKKGTYMPSILTGTNILVVTNSETGRVFLIDLYTGLYYNNILDLERNPKKGTKLPIK